MCNLVLALCALAAIVYWGISSSSTPGGILHGARIWSSSYLVRQSGLDSGLDMASDDDGCDLHDPNEEPLPAVRKEFGGVATIVYGWPSTGGVWVHESCYGVELDFLQLSRFERSATERFSAKEDDFCKRLEWIGARFYESERDYNRQSSRSQKSQWWYAWPGTVPDGGVWVLRIREFERAEMGVSRIRNALSMAERCQAIEMLGGKFYENWEDVGG